MRKRGVLLCAAAVVSACGGASAATSSRSTPAPPPARAAAVPCGPAGARTLASSAVARVYVSGRTVFGCSKLARKQLKLGNSNSCLRGTLARPAAVAGEVAAYGIESCGVDTGRGSLIVRRLDTGKTLHTQPALSGRVGVEGHSSVESVVVRADGSAAWIGSERAIGPPRRGTEVHAVTRTGSVLLDSGVQIDAGSLRLRGSRLSWRHGGRTRTATLR